MSFDWYALLDTMDKPSWTELPSLAQRQLCALQVMGGSDTQKNDAKSKAREIVQGPHCWPEPLSFPGPGAESPFLRRGLSIELRWNLQSPFFSRSESEFDAVDNPIARDSLSQLPILRASGAKGMLRHVFKQFAEPELEAGLFGELNRDASDEISASAGSLVVGDVLFDRVASDVFSPHDRTFAVVDHPVFFEVVPAGANARWGLQLTRLDPETGPRELELLLRAIADLLLLYGMSAKRSSGYGMAEERVVVRIRTGKSVKLPEHFQVKEGSDFPEPRPAEAAKKSGEPQYFTFLSDGMEMLCPREQALDFLLQARFPGSVKKDKQKAREKKSFKAKWEKKDAAGKLWDSCRAFLEQQQNFDPEADERAALALQQWEKEQARWEAGREVYCEFTSLAAALEAVKDGLEVTA